MSKITMLDLAKLNGNDQAVGIIEESLKTCPELANFPARQVAGTSYHTVRRTGRPAVGFRSANAGVDASKSTFEKVLAEMYILSARIEVDRAIADAYEQGAAHLQAVEAAGVGQALLESVGAQVWYGKSADANGFQGLQQLSTNVTVSDTTSGTGNTSVYLVRYGENNGVSFDFGKNSTIDLSEFRLESIADSNGKKYPGYVADLCGWIGMRLATAEGVARIANVREQATKAGLSDKIIAKALSNWRGAAPDAIYMNRTAAYLLQCSRSVTIMAGPTQKASGIVGAFADFPVESNGIPIVITDALSDTEEFVA